MLDFTQEITSIIEKKSALVNEKTGEKRFTDFRVDFIGTVLYVSAVFDGKKRRSVGSFATFFIPTEKGYMSAKWKKTKFFKGIENVGQDVINELEPYLQSEKPKTFIRNTGGITVAHAIMNQVNDAGSMLEEYSK
jgi:hypothetical protein